MRLRSCLSIRVLAGSVLAGAAWLAPFLSAHAQSSEPAAVVPAQPAPTEWRPPPPEHEVPRLMDKTALSLDKGELEIGVLAFRYGITDWLSVATAPVYFLLRSFEPVLVPNLNFKFVLFRSEDLWVAADVGAFVGLVGNGGASGTVLLLPLAGVVSAQLVPRFWIHPAFVYSLVEAFGTGDYTRFTVGGSAATRTAQIAMTLQYQLTDLVSLTLWGRYQVYTGSVAMNGSGSIDAFTTADVDARVTPASSHPWAVVPGVALLWKHLRVTLGVGYGNYFVPGAYVSMRGTGFVPDGSISYVF